MKIPVPSNIFTSTTGKYSEIIKQYGRGGEKAVISLPIDWENETLYLVYYQKGFLGMPFGVSPSGILLINSQGQPVKRKMAEDIIWNCFIYLDFIGPSDTRTNFLRKDQIDGYKLYNELENVLTKAKKEYTPLYAYRKGLTQVTLESLFDTIITMARIRKEIAASRKTYINGIIENVDKGLKNGTLSSNTLRTVLDNFIKYGEGQYKDYQSVLVVKKELADLEFYFTDVIIKTKGEESHKAIEINKHIEGVRSQISSAEVYGKSSIGNVILENFQNFFNKEIKPNIRNR